MIIKDIGPSYRKKDEKYEDYAIRRKKENRFVENYLEGKNIWNAAVYSTFTDKKKQEEKRARKEAKKIKKEFMKIAKVENE